MENNIDEEVMDLSVERVVLAYQRTLKELKIPFEGGLDGPVLIHDEDLPEGFEDEFAMQLKMMVVADMMQDFLERDIVAVSGIDEDGSLAYSLTEFGYEVASEWE